MKLSNKLTLVAALAVSTFTATNLMARTNTSEPTLAGEVRHELVMLPYLGVFDDLKFQVDDHGVVTLAGQVARPVLRSDAGRLVSRIPGVTSVINNIEVLPLSPADDRIRIATYRTIFGYSPLQRYGMGAVPAIHIIVKNGNVTLEGRVSSDMDKQLAGMRANQVFGVFSVTNDLIVERS